MKCFLLNSDIAIKYMEWIGKIEGKHIQHAGNGKEKQIIIDDKITYYVDGFIQDGEANIVHEFLGCYYHGCS